MASHSLRMPVSQAREHVRARMKKRDLPLATAIIIFAALLILFGWLHFVLALQITATNEQIQARTEDWWKLKRDNATIRRELAEALSPRRMEPRAIGAGYRPQKPVHLVLPHLMAEDTKDGTVAGAPSTEAATSAENSTTQAKFPFEAVVDEVDTWLEARTRPWRPILP
jgi:cell division protein FtsB